MESQKFDSLKKMKLNFDLCQRAEIVCRPFDRRPFEGRHLFDYSQFNS